MTVAEGIAVPASARTATGAATRSVSIRGRRYDVLLPSWRDPRLHLAATITSLQVLGQTTLHFELSIAQILVSLLTCGLIELVVRFVRERAIAWPASALLTGNGIAFLVRVNGTVPGDRWSMRGAWIFAATGAVAVGSKYVLRVGGRPLLNPSNAALVACFVVLGTDRVNPLDLWWAPMSPTMVAVYGIIAAGGVIVTGRTRMVPASLAFAVAFAASTAVVARGGHCMAARWNVGPVCGAHYWRVLVTSPEVLIFLLFMITDPKTAPRGRVARVLYGALVGVVAAAAASTQTKEFGTKVALLAALVGACALRPLLEAIAPEPASAADRWWRWVARHRGGVRPGLGVARLATASMCAVTGVIGVAGIASPYGVDQRPIDEVTAAAVVVDLTGAPALPPVGLDADLASLHLSVTQEDADAMALDLSRALTAVDAALAGRDVGSVRGLVSRRHLATIEPRFGAGTPAGYVFDALTVTVHRAVGDLQAPPQVALRGVGRREDGTPVDRIFPMVEVAGRWVLDGDVDHTI